MPHHLNYGNKCLQKFYHKNSGRNNIFEKKKLRKEVSPDRAGAKVTAMTRHTFDQVECDSARMEIAYRLERENGKRPLL